MGSFTVITKNQQSLSRVEEIAYSRFEGMPDAATLKQMIQITEQVFGRLKMPKESFIALLASRRHLLFCGAWVGNRLVGFKVGYERSLGQFYSQVGGVLPRYRRRGVASKLMRMQHLWCKRAGFKLVRTETRNTFRDMLVLNLRHGFEVIGTYRDEEEEVRIILEKKLG